MHCVTLCCFFIFLKVVINHRGLSPLSQSEPAGNFRPRLLLQHHQCLSSHHHMTTWHDVTWHEVSITEFVLWLLPASCRQHEQDVYTQNTPISYVYSRMQMSQTKEANIACVSPEHTHRKHIQNTHTEHTHRTHTGCLFSAAPAVTSVWTKASALVLHLITSSWPTSPPISPLTASVPQLPVFSSALLYVPCFIHSQTHSLL